jgi:hypothetical protein
MNVIWHRPYQNIWWSNASHGRLVIVFSICFAIGKGGCPLRISPIAAWLTVPALVVTCLSRPRRPLIEAGLAPFDEHDPEINHDKMKHERMGLPHNRKRKATGRADRFRRVSQRTPSFACVRS